MDRVQQGLAATISFTFQVDGVATNPTPDSATVRIVRANGSELVATTAAVDAGTGVFTFALTPAHTALLDVLTVYWTATLSAQAQTFKSTIEVVGGFFFTIAEARTLEELSDAGDYPASDIAQARTLAESAIEEECGRAFVPRYAREEISGRGTTRLRLTARDLRAIRDATMGGTALTAPQLAELVVDGRELYRSYGWDVGTRNVVVGYEHGLDYPPPRLARAALILAKNWLVKGPIDDRAVSIPAGEAGGTISLLTPGVRGAVFGIPEVDSVVQRYRVRELVG